MESVLEQQRLTHEEIERLEIAVVNEYRQIPKNQKEKVAQDHCLNELVEKISGKSRKLIELYEDHDGLRREEMEALSGQNAFNEFYKRLKTIKDAHRRFPNEPAVPLDFEFSNLSARREEIMEAMETTFTGEEAYGRFLDLHALHDQFVNLKQFERNDYMAYVSTFDKLSDTPKEKKTADYKKYLENLHQYLEGFLKKVKPLTDLSRVYSEVETLFEEDWATSNTLKSSEAKEDEDKALYCAACVKQFAKQSVFDAHLTGKKHIKAAALLDSQKVGIGAHQQAKSQKDAEKEKQLALIEARIVKLAELLQAERENTKSNIERKQARTVDERDEDMNVEEDNESEEDDDEKIYNPLKLPLGWDGKPIPYWLYKLHGLGVEYTCEICGNYVYMGRKPFERHFTEWRHTYGLRCLGIPNIKHFAEVTTIEGAKTLWAKIQKEKDKVVFKPEQEEEYEDHVGNVFNKKTYEDLKRQGLL